jgi:parallel beta-helix repeat protein
LNGISLASSGDTTICNNEISNNTNGGIRLQARSSGNNVTANNFTENGEYAVGFSFSSNNLFYRNNLVGNENQILIEESVNMWDDGYPSGGNYWSDYNGSDLYSGFYQNETGSDGIGDVSYGIDANNMDRFPLKGPDYSFDAGTWNGVQYGVDIVSNSTVSGFYFNASEGAFLMFTVTGEGGTEGFWRVTIPKDLLWVEDGWIVVVQYPPLFPPPSSFKTFSDENCTYLYFTFTYTNPSQNGSATVTINGTHVISEFPSFLILPLFFISTLLAVIAYRKKQAKISGSP